jgi:peptidyl-prolyl cis-trans isomerase C
MTMMNLKSLGLLLLVLVSSCHAFVVQPSLASTQPSALKMCDFFDNFMKQFSSPSSQSKQANASHILVKGGPEARKQLQDLKARIGNDPIKFSDAAAEYSDCPSGRDKGGNLGDFSPGQMVKEFDRVVFSDDAIGVVHGPIQTEFGYNLILINERD